MVADSMFERVALAALSFSQFLLAFVGIAAVLYVAGFVVAEVRAVSGKGKTEPAYVPEVLTESTRWVTSESSGGRWVNGEVER